MSTRWKPKVYDRYWYVESLGTASSLSWHNDDVDKEHFKCGNCFQTREQADEMLEKIKKVLLEGKDDIN